MSHSSGTPERFHVAVSFAGEDRALVESVVRRLIEADIEVFYDEDQKVESWGKDLIEFFTDVYTNRSRYALMFISRHYAEKMWTRLERRAILAAALNRHDEYVLPVRLDDTRLDGLLDTVGYLDARLEGAMGIAEAAIEKVGGRSVERDPVWTGGVPRDEVSTQTLLAVRPPAWEWLYFGGLLLQGVDRNEARYLDVEIGYAPHRTSVADLGDAHEYLRSMPTRMLDLADKFNRVLAADAQERAVGAPGEPGDPDRIAHLANRLVGIYEAFLDLVEEFRGTVVPEPLALARDLSAEAGTRAITDFRSWVHSFAETLEPISAKLLAGENVTINQVLTLEVDSAVLKRWSKEMNRVAKRG